MTRQRFSIIFVLLLAVIVSLITLRLFRNAHQLYQDSGSIKLTEYSWVFRLMLNCLGYASVFLPGFILLMYLRRYKYFDSTEKRAFSRPLFMLFGDYDYLPDVNRSKSESEYLRTPMQECLGVLFCFCGLMGSYLTWGLLQEKIMTQPYTNKDGTQTLYRDSQFLVFVNRLSAFVVGTAYVLATRQIELKVPFYKFSFCSFSNIMSAWCQYEALKFISFPTQVLSKACKIIPVMLMGKLVSNKKYEFYEYFTAILISAGMILFLCGSSDDYTGRASTVTTLSGVILLALYMLFDSFTSNWQDSLFKKYPTLTPIQMMACVNWFSCVFTVISLLQQDGIQQSWSFMVEHPSFAYDTILLSASSAVGQLFIYYTIASYGPVVFTIIMTLRQAFAIILSCIVYHHNIGVMGIFGIIIIFLAILLRLYCRRRLKKVKVRVDP